jgi:hypothetical protein
VTNAPAAATTSIDAGSGTAVIRRDRPETSAWHHVNIPVDDPKDFNRARDGRNGDNVIDAIDRHVELKGNDGDADKMHAFIDAVANMVKVAKLTHATANPLIESAENLRLLPCKNDLRGKKTSLTDYKVISGTRESFGSAHRLLGIVGVQPGRSGSWSYG